MDLYLNPSDVSEVIGIDEDIIAKTLERKHPAIEPFLRVVASASDDIGERTKAILQLRIDGLAPLITQLSFNIPTNEIIENLICQVVNIAYLRENTEKLEDENAQLQATVKTLQDEKADLRVELNNLQEEKSMSWINRFFKSKN